MLDSSRSEPNASRGTFYLIDTARVNLYVNYHQNYAHRVNYHKMHTVIDDAQCELAIKSIELASCCAAHRGSFESFGPQYRSLSASASVSGGSWQVLALCAAILPHCPHFLSLLASPASTCDVWL